MRYSNRKIKWDRNGQIFGLDAIVAFMVTFLFISLFISVWNSNVLTIYLEKDNIDTEYKGQYLSSILVSHPGVPNNWDILPTSQIDSAGIVLRQNVVLKEKFARLMSLSPSEQRKYLKSPFSFNITVYWANKTPVIFDNNIYSFGVALPPTPRSITVYQLPVYFRTREKILGNGYLKVIVWA